MTPPRPAGRVRPGEGGAGNGQDAGAGGGQGGGIAGLLGGTPLEVVLSGPESELLQSLAEEIRARLDSMPQVTQAWMSTRPGLDEIWVEPEHRAFEAFGRSWGLTKGSRGKVVFLFIVATLLFNVIPQFILAFIGSSMMGSSPRLGMGIQFASYLVPIVLYPAISCVLTLMYYDLRVRREAFDGDFLTANVD